MAKYFVVTRPGGEQVLHPGEWHRTTGSGTLQIREGRFRVLARYRPGEYASFTGIGGSHIPEGLTTVEQLRLYIPPGRV